MLVELVYVKVVAIVVELVVGVELHVERIAENDVERQQPAQSNLNFIFYVRWIEGVRLTGWSEMDEWKYENIEWCWNFLLVQITQLATFQNYDKMSFYLVELDCKRQYMLKFKFE